MSPVLFLKTCIFLNFVTFNSHCKPSKIGLACSSKFGQLFSNTFENFLKLISSTRGHFGFNSMTKDDEERRGYRELEGEMKAVGVGKEEEKGDRSRFSDSIMGVKRSIILVSRLGGR